MEAFPFKDSSEQNKWEIEGLCGVADSLSFLTIFGILHSAVLRVCYAYAKNV